MKCSHKMKANPLALIATLLLVKAVHSELTPVANLTLETAHHTCLLGCGIKVNPIKDFLYGKFDDDKQLAQYFHCMFRMYGLLDIQSNLRNETIFEVIRTLEKDQSNTEEAVRLCQDDIGNRNTTQQEIAYEFFKCFRNYTEDAYYWSILKYLLNKHRIHTALSPTQSLKLETVHYTCAMSDVQWEPIKDSLNGVYSNDEHLAEYFQCVFRMYGYLDASGSLKNETMLNAIPSEDKNKSYTEDAIKSCQYVSPPTPNATAYEFFKCFRNATDDAEYWVTLKELSSKNDKQDVSNVLVDFL